MEAIYNSLSDYLGLVDARDNMADLSDEQRQQIAATAAATAAAVADTALVLNQIAAERGARLLRHGDDDDDDGDLVEVPRRHQPCSVTTFVGAQHDRDRFEHVSRSKSPRRHVTEETTQQQQHHHQLHTETVVVNFFAGDVAVRSHEHPEQEIRIIRAVEAPEEGEVEVEITSPPPAKSSPLPPPPPPPPPAVSEDEQEQTIDEEQTPTRLTEEALAEAAAMADDLGAEGLAEPVIAGTISDQMIQEAEEEEENEEENERPSASRQSSLLSLSRPPPPLAVRPSTSSQGSSHWARRRELKEARQEQGRRLAEQAALHRTQHPNQKSSRVTKSQRAGVVFPVTRVLSALKKLEPHRRVTEVAGVYLCSTLEYLCAELLEMGGNAAIATKRNRITPRHLFLAVQQDPEFFELLKDVTMRQGGVVPNISEALLDTKKNVAKTMPKNEARVEAAKKAAATRKRNAAAASTSGSSKKKSTTATASHGRRKAESDAEELHEVRVEAGKKAAATHKKFVKQHHLEHEEHEMRVKAGKKAALARKKHELGLEPKKSEYAAIDRAPLTEEEEEGVEEEEEETTPSKRKRKTTTTAAAAEETTHEKRVRAGKKGAEARKRHKQEREEAESEPPASQESRTASRVHAKHVAAGKKGAETRKHHLLELVEQVEHEKHVQAGKKAAETRRRHKKEREAGEAEDDESEYSVEEEEETEETTEDTEETEETEEETPRSARKRARDQYDFKATTSSGGTKTLKRSRSIEEAPQTVAAAAKRRSSRSMSDTDVSELNDDIKRRRIEMQMLKDECHQLATVKAGLMHDIQALEKPKRGRKQQQQQQQDPEQTSPPASETSEAAPTTTVELTVTKVASAAETGLQTARET